MTRARDNSFNPFNNQVAGKNAIINGAFDFWQRGTSFTNTGQVYTADRWPMSPNGGSMTISRINADLSGFRYAMRVQRPQGGTTTAQIYMGQGLVTEDVIHMQGKQVTISFYARAGSNYSAANSLLSLGANWGTGTGGYVYGPLTNDALLFNTSFTLTTSWQRFSYTFTMPTTMTEFRFYPYYTQSGTAGANDYYDMTGWQLELGSNATQFSRYGGNINNELAACQRYYWQTSSSPNPSTTIMTGALASGTTTVAQLYCALPVTMRTTPSASLNTSGLIFWDATGGGASYTVGSITSQSSSTSQGSLNISSTGLTNNNRYNLLATANATGFVAFSAEL